MTTKRRTRHSPAQIVCKLRDGDAMLNAGKDLAAVLQSLEISESIVVVTLDWYGGNGNPQHAAVAQGAVFAARITGDKSQYPEQVKEFGVWQPKKVYLHVPDKDRHKYDSIHSHSWTSTCQGDPSTTVQYSN